MKVALFINIYKDESLLLAKNAVALLKSRGAAAVVSDEFSDKIPDAESAPEALLCRFADYAVVIGGDGTVIRAAHLTAPAGVPVIGINLGAVGFLTAITPDETEKLNCLFDGGFEVSERLMLEAEVEGKKYTALNDFVVSAGNISQMAKVSLSVCGGYELDYKCTGLIVSTPTGSTAYNLSAGGAVIDPEFDCIAVTPVCPHGFSQKSMVFPPERELCLRNTSSADKDVFLTADGAEQIVFPHGSLIRIRSSETRAKLLFLPGDSSLKRLREKLK